MQLLEHVILVYQTVRNAVALLDALNALMVISLTTTNAFRDAQQENLPRQAVPVQVVSLIVTLAQTLLLVVLALLAMFA